MKKVTIKFDPDSDTITIDLGGDLDKTCCGEESQRIAAALEAHGLKLTPQRVVCRLPVWERCIFKAKGLCDMSPLKSDSTLGRVE